MAKKKFVLRLEDEVYSSIEKWADDDFRSVNGQIEWMLHQMLKQAKRHQKGIKEDNKVDKNDVN